MAAAPPSAGDDELSGTVMETMGAPGYTYARLDHNGKEIWIAGPETKIAVGMKLGRMQGNAMPGFHSTTLNRTFDMIYFVNEIPRPDVGTSPHGAMAMPGQDAAAAGDAVEGTVVETMDASTYTYARLDRNGASLWVAGPATKLAVGAKLGRMTGSLMTNFRSDTLNRTFDRIYFIQRFATDGAAAAPSATPAAPAVADKDEKIEKVPLAPGGKTIAEIYAGKDALAGKPIAVRGKVVKLNNGIMGRNWIHVRDGSGAAGTNDLLVTTQATSAKLGDVILVHGTVATKQDFGASYKYDVLIENATLE